MHEVRYRAIGIIHSPHKTPEGTPIQPTAAAAAEGTVEIFPDYARGLRDLDGFSHVILLYHFHRSKGVSLTVTPFMDDRTHGVFATRAPSRPNPIGLSTVELLGIKENVLRVVGLDMLDETPLLDIKPYVPEIDAREVTARGWLTERITRLQTSRDDGRFTG